MAWMRALRPWTMLSRIWLYMTFELALATSM